MFPSGVLPKSLNLKLFHSSQLSIESLCFPLKMLEVLQSLHFIKVETFVSMSLNWIFTWRPKQKNSCSVLVRSDWWVNYLLFACHLALMIWIPWSKWSIKYCLYIEHQRQLHSVPILFSLSSSARILQVMSNTRSCRSIERIAYAKGNFG